MTATATATATAQFAILSSATFGPFRRYKLEVCRSRFDTLVYFVTDAEQLDEYDMPDVIRLSESDDEALAGLEGSDSPEVNEALVRGLAAYLGIQLD